MGFPKGFDFAGCVEITFVLRDFQVLTGRFKGYCDEDRKGNHGSSWDKDDHKDGKGKQDDHKDNKGKQDDLQNDKDNQEEKCCKPPKVDVNVEVEEKCKFILLELTRPAAAANLSSVTCSGGIEELGLTLSGTTFPEGTCVVVNTDNIIYAGPGATFCDFPLIISTDASGAVTLSVRR